MYGSLPFEGITIVDFTHVLAGPACAYYFGLLGAEVIKIEAPIKGDAVRHRGGTDPVAAQSGMSTPYLTQAAGKKSVCLDLEKPEGNQALHALFQDADVFIENHVPVTMQKLSLDNETITKRHKHLIYCSMTGYGRNGPQENTPAYDVNIQAACGLMNMTGTPQSGPVRTGAPILDYSTAIVAAFAISAALFERTKTGNGAFIDVSMLETGLTLMSSSITDYLKTGNEPKRCGNLANSRSPGAGTFECKHGIISLGINEEKHFKYLAIALNKVAWIDDPRFSTRSSRQLNVEILNTELSKILKTRSATDWEVILQNNGVPSARLRSLSEALNCKQIKSRGFVQCLEDGMCIPTLPFRMNNVPFYKPKSSAPNLGEHTSKVLASLNERKKNN